MTWECARCGHELSSKPMALETCRKCECPAFANTELGFVLACEHGYGAKDSETCVGCSTPCPFDWQDPEYPHNREESRIDVIGQNGNEGEHYDELVELDPNGIDQHEPGAKLDAGKPMAAILGDFGLALLEVAKVGTFGAKKYTRNGWEHVEDGQIRYRDAAFRHMLKRHVESVDPETGIDHLAAVIWNCCAELEIKLREARGDLQ